MDQADGGHYRTDEIRQFLEHGMSETERYRLHGWARAYVVGSEIDPNDLVQEAYVAALSGDRKCRRDLSIMVFLKSTLRSLANGEFQAAWRRHREFLSEDDEAAFLTHKGMPAGDPAQEQIARDACDRLLEACAANQAAYDVLLCRGAGYTPEETQREAGLSKVEYASALTYIRRTANRIFPGATR